VDTVASLEQRAIDLAKRGEFGSDARGVNEELTRLAPANQAAWTRLARCCLELGLLDDATAALDAVLQLNPQNTIARNLQIDVGKRRAGPVLAPVRKRSTTRAAAGPRTARSGETVRSSRAGIIALAGIGRAEFTALAHLPPNAAAESLTARIEPLLMALNDRPFAAKAVEARNRAAKAGVRLFRRGSVQPGSPGHVYVLQQGGRWEPQLNVGFFARPTWGQDAISAGIVFNLAEEGTDDMADAGRERLFAYFQAFQQLLSATWRQHVTDWMRANGGFIQFGHQPPAIDVLPYDAVERLIRQEHPGELGWVSLGRWLFADRGEDIGIMTDGPRLVRWLEQTFNDLLPLWGTIYRDKYKS
jgi:Tetratricopeptide repeat